MKLISLNIWGGIVFEPLMKFVRDHAGDTDFFCFQEVFDTPTDRTEAQKGARANIFHELQSVLPDHIGHFAPAQDRYEYTHNIHGDSDWDIAYGLACFIKKGVPLSNYGEFFVFMGRNEINDGGASNAPRNIQYIQWEWKGVPTTVLNFHGMWHPTIKKIDCPERIEQSQKIRAFMDVTPGEKILCGDFNLMPDTESLAILESGMRNLVKEYGIATTRSELYPKEQKFADYTLVTPGIHVTSFSVPNINVSDHLPMILEFS